MIQKQGRHTLKTPIAHGNMSKPIVLVFAGPNGSGKCTITTQIPHYVVYINADDLKKEYDLTDPEAAQKAEALRNKLVEEKADFSFETVLSTERNLLPQIVDVCDKLLIYDNSIMPFPVFKKDGEGNACFPTGIWPIKKLKELLMR